LLPRVIPQFAIGSRFRAGIASLMHILMATMFTIGALAFLVLGLIRVLYDLLERGPYDAPLVEKTHRQEDPSKWSADGAPGRNEICH
jgi:hypothetical protein